MSPLGDSIFGLSVKGAFDATERSFLPNGSLDTLVTREAVLSGLGGYQDGDAELVRFVLQEAKKVFAIMVHWDFNCTELRKATGLFKRFKIYDEKLPMEQPAPNEENGKFTVEKYKTPLQPPFQDTFWTVQKVNNFWNSQWHFLAPTFSDDTHCLELPPETILPITSKHPVVKEGAFSQVFQVTVHPAHLKFSGVVPPPNIAIKEVRRNDDRMHEEALQEAFEKELEISQVANALNHDYIVRRIAAFKKGEKRYFMSPWADGGNLQEFWEKNNVPELSAERMKETISQLHGLAEAIFKFSTENIRHGDIKPENILVFHGGEKWMGTLKIADLGLAKQHTVATQQRHCGTTRTGAYDSWPMECIMLELLIWLLYVYNELTRFRVRLEGNPDGSEPARRTPFFKEEWGNQGRAARVHHVVEHWMDHISRDQECDGETAMKDLLDIIRAKVRVKV
ncbi:hypothetical protein DL769_009898 [Monosporascus sp. CRB-8-3]|nr:hypothetical protein DL769_009898 [Monosporascus sp. CRB-8-3]